MFVMTVKIQLSNVQGQEKVFTLVEHHVQIHTVELDKISEPEGRLLQQNLHSTNETSLKIWVSPHLQCCEMILGELSTPGIPRMAELRQCCILCSSIAVMNVLSLAPVLYNCIKMLVNNKQILIKCITSCPMIPQRLEEVEGRSRPILHGQIFSDSTRVRRAHPTKFTIQCRLEVTTLTPQ